MVWWMSGVVDVLFYPWCGGCLRGGCHTINSKHSVLCSFTLYLYWDRLYPVLSHSQSIIYFSPPFVEWSLHKLMKENKDVYILKDVCTLRYDVCCFIKCII